MIGQLEWMQVYAEHYGVTTDEAIRRSNVEEQGRYLMHLLEDREPQTYGGLFLQHSPEFKIVALFTRDGEDTLSKYLVDELRDAVEVRYVAFSYRDLVRSHQEAIALFTGLGFKTDSHVDVMRNSVVVNVLTRDFAGYETAVRDGKLVLPQGVIVEAVAGLMTAE